MSSTETSTDRRDSEANRFDAGGPRPLPFQFQIPIGGGPLGIGVPLGGPGSPLAFTLPLGGTTSPSPAPQAATPPMPPTAPASGSDLSPVTVAVPDNDSGMAAGEAILAAAEAWGDGTADRKSTADFLTYLAREAGRGDEGRLALDLGDARPTALMMFRVLAGPDRGARRQLERWARVIAAPGTPLDGVRPLPGDLLLRVARGEGWGCLGVVASAGLHSHDRLADLDLRFEGYPRLTPGRYVHIMEPGIRFRGADRRFCRRLTDGSGTVLANTMLLRVRSLESEAETIDGENFDLSESTPAYICGSELSPFGRGGRAADLSAGRRPRPRIDSGRAVCAGQIDLVMTGPDGGTVDLLLWNFDIDGSYTKLAHEAALDRLIFELHQHLRGATPTATAYTIHLSGFASHTGNTAHNITLANAREDTAQSYLVANLEKYMAAGETPISPVITFAHNPGGFDPAAPPTESDHARSARVIAVPSGSPLPPPRPFPPDLRALLDLIAAVLGSLPLGRLGVAAPTDARFLTAAEQATAMTVFGGSLDFTKIVITNGLGFQGRPFTVVVHVPSGWYVALNQGPGAIAKDWSLGSESNTLIYELTHGWQSQHASDHTAFMLNSISSQSAAVARTEAERAAAYTRAAAAWELSHPFDLAGAMAAGRAAAAVICFDPYAYVPSRAFTDYAAEQTAQIVEDAYVNGRVATDAVVSHIRSIAANVLDPDNDTSLRTARFERRGGPGVASSVGACPGL